MIFTFAGKKGSKEFPHYALELHGPRFWNFGQLTLLSIDLTFRWRGDHAPSFYFLPCICNVQLFEIHFYNTRHED